MQSIRYMGSKRKLTKDIWDFIRNRKIINSDKYFIDLFAGTNSVAIHFKNKLPVVTNDIQEFSKILSLALVKNNTDRISNEEKIELLDTATKYYNEISKDFKDYIDVEMDLLDKKDIENYRKYSESFPHYSSDKKITEHPLKEYFSHSNNMSLKNKNKYLLITTYFNNSYFSLKQSLEIDSFCYAIDIICEGWKTHGNLEIKRAIYLSCLMSTLSIAVNSTSHFAQYHKIKEENFKWILERRLKSIQEIFLEKIDEFNQNFVESKYKHLSFNKDSTEFLSSNKNIINNACLVYIDPPYSTAPYSRFYHVLETLVKYDYPESRFNGRYREGRHISKFNQKKDAEKAFVNLIEQIRDTGTPLLFSYPYKNDLGFNAENLIELCRNYYKNVIPVNFDHSHQGFGNINAANGQTEYLILCK